MSAVPNYDRLVSEVCSVSSVNFLFPIGGRGRAAVMFGWAPGSRAAHYSRAALLHHLQQPVNMSPPWSQVTTLGWPPDISHLYLYSEV